MTQSSALSPQARDAALAAMSEGAELPDVLVVGGGIVGAGTALDSVTRGLATGLVEQRDLASGTSSRSSKLIHGGLRYLEMLDFGLVREALDERGLLFTRLAPHLVRAVHVLYPLHRTWERPYVGAGLALYDAMAMLGKYDMGVPRHRHLFRRQVARMAPDLKTENLSGAIRYYDCQVDDARLVVTVARTAVSHGAHVATRTRVTGFLREGERVVGCAPGTSRRAVRRGHHALGGRRRPAAGAHRPRDRRHPVGAEGPGDAHPGRAQQGPRARAGRRGQGASTTTAGCWPCPTPRSPSPTSGPRRRPTATPGALAQEYARRIRQMLR